MCHGEASCKDFSVQGLGQNKILQTTDMFINRGKENSNMFIQKDTWKELNNVNSVPMDQHG